MKAADDDKIISHFDAAFSNFEVTPPKTVWDGVVSGLQRRARIILWRKLGVAAALLVIFSIPAILFLSQQGENVSLAGQNGNTIENGTTAKPADVLIADADNGIASSVAIESVHQANQKISQTPFRKKPASKELLEAEKTTLKHLAGDLTTSIKDNQILAQDTSNHTPTETSNQMVARLEESQTLKESGEAKRPLPITNIHQVDPNQEAFNLKQNEEKSWQIAAALSTIQGLSGSKMDYLFSSQKALFDANAYTNNLSLETGNFANIENTTHAQPLTLGINFSRKLSKHWAVESGLLFTRLGSSSKTYLDNERHTIYKNQLIYLGLPASVRYNLLNKKRFEIYLVQGIVLEKGLSADYETRRYRNDRLYDFVSGSFDVSGVQISSLTSAGVGLKFSQHISIYIQPGMQVFFLNKTQPYNIRSSQSAWPALQTGLRVQL